MTRTAPTFAAARDSAARFFADPANAAVLGRMLVVHSADGSLTLWDFYPDRAPRPFGPATVPDCRALRIEHKPCPDCPPNRIRRAVAPDADTCHDCGHARADRAMATEGGW